MSDNTIENQNADQKPLTLKPGTILAASKISRALITRENSPRVTIVTGKETIFITGLIKIFIIPNTIESTTAPTRLTLVPGAI